MKIKTKKVKQNKYGGKIKYKHYSNKKTRKYIQQIVFLDKITN